METTNTESSTNITEIVDGIYRISTPIPPGPAMPGGFSFNFHTGPRKLFPVVRAAIETVIPVSTLRYIPSEIMRSKMDYYAHSADTGKLIDKLAATQPNILACMHGSAWKGDGAKLLGELANALER